VQSDDIIKGVFFIAKWVLILFLKDSVKKTDSLIPYLSNKTCFFMTFCFKLNKKVLEKCSQHLLFVLKNLRLVKFRDFMLDKVTQTTYLLIKFTKLYSLIWFFCCLYNVDRFFILSGLGGLGYSFHRWIWSSTGIHLSCYSINDWRVVNQMEFLRMGLAPQW